MITVTHSTYSIKGISYEPAEDNLLNWKCSIKGAVCYSLPCMITIDSKPSAQSDSPYKGGTFYFKLTLPEDFPFKAPTVWHIS